MTSASAGSLTRGALAGAIAWWAMDRTLRFIYDRQSAAVRHGENSARGGVPALEVLAERLASLAHRTLSEEERQAAGTALQWLMGIGAGTVYPFLRNHLPGSGISRGLTYGAGFWLLVDEGMTVLLGLAPGPTAFPSQTHARGMAGHLVFGAVAEAVLGVLEERR